MQSESQHYHQHQQQHYASDSPAPSVSPLSASEDHSHSPEQGHPPARTKVKRQSAACTRCRRYRQKCVHSVEEVPGSSSLRAKTRPVAPCQGCILVGQPEECLFTPRGHSATDRSFRRKASTEGPGQGAKLTLSTSPGRQRKASGPSQGAGPPPPLSRGSEVAPALLPARVGAVSATGVGSTTPPSHPASIKTSRVPIAIPGAVDSFQHTDPHALARGPPPPPPSRPTGLVAAAPAYDGGYYVDSPPAPLHRDAFLPPIGEIVEAVHVLCFSYFQLGFISEHYFIDRLRRNPNSVSPFLLLSLLAVSARFTPSLISRFGSRFQASEYFSSRALALVPQEALTPSLEATQAFFFLAANDWGQGLGERSWMLMGIAVRMAGVLRLHREETYQLGPNPTPTQIIDTEIARRTFWIIHLHDDLCTTLNRPRSFALHDITALLPCDEDDYLSARLPERRASLMGTAAALRQPDTVSLPDRPLFTSMIQSTSLWGKVAKKACSIDGLMNERPWELESEFATLHHELVQWEKQLPPTHKWTEENLRHWKSNSQDLAYFAVNGTLRLSHMVLARMYLPLLAAHLDQPTRESSSISSGRASPTAPFWAKVAHVMSAEAYEILSQADLFFTTRSPLDGFSPVILFSVYIAGDVSSYILRWPHLCPAFAGKAESMFARALNILGQSMQAWPIATRWHSNLMNARNPNDSYGEGLKPDLKSIAKMDLALDRSDGIYRNNSIPSDSSGLRAPSSSTSSNPSPTMNAGADLLLGLHGPDGRIGSTSGFASLSVSASSLPPPIMPISGYHHPHSVSNQPASTSLAGPSHNASGWFTSNLGTELTVFLEATPSADELASHALAAGGVAGSYGGDWHAQPSAPGGWGAAAGHF